MQTRVLCRPVPKFPYQLPREELFVPSSTQTLSIDDGDQTFSMLVRMVDALVEAWETGDDPPQLADFLPADEATRRLVLIELIKVDLEYRWQRRNLPKRIGDYLDEFPELADGGVPVALVYEEFHLRRNCGFNVDPQEYLEQFPHQADELQRLLGLDDTYEPTATYNPTGKEALNLVNAGDSLDDFDLLTLLGRGAFAKVFLARQRSMQRLVALKISVDSGHEPQTLAQFDHENIVRVYDHRIDEPSGLRLLYMQYCPGGTLHDVVRMVTETDPANRTGDVLLRSVERLLEHRGESPPAESALGARLREMSWPETVCWIGARLAAALDYSHSRGVLHRDIKPANVLLSREGVPKLADFNISFSSKVEGATPAAYFGGSLAYMSIEQLEAYNPGCDRNPSSLDGRCDQFSLGVLLWELLAGRRPFADKVVSSRWSRTLGEMVDRRRAGVGAEALEHVPADCPPGLVRVLLRCLAPNPDDRWPGGTELARQLDLCRNSEVQQLLNPPPNSWQMRTRRFAVPAVVLAAAVPNILAGAFNFAYNWFEIPETRLPEFAQVMTIINSVAYPLALGLLMCLAMFVVRVIRQLEAGENVAGDRLRAANRWCLSLGHAAAMIGVVVWTIAGLAYPLAIHLATGQVRPLAYAQFLGSLVLCGLISAAYPYFGVTSIALRVLYPQLLGKDCAGGGDVHLLERLNQRCWFYLMMAVSVPLVAVLILAVIPMKSLIPLQALSGGTLIGFGIVFWCFRRLQRDLASLIDALSPEHNR